jgi:type IV secretory pathway VirJ component
MKARALAALLLVACCDSEPAAPPPPPAEQIDAGRLGAVALRHPDDAPEALVFLFGATGRDADAAAQKLVDADAAVVTVDLAKYQAGLRASDDGCHYLISEIEALSKKLQRQLDATAYRSPILAGVGEGATLAYAALAQSPSATIAGAVSVDPTPALHTKVPLCPGAPSTPVAGGAFSYGPQSSLPGFWRVSSRTPLAPELAELVDSPDAGPPPGDAPLDRLVALVLAQLDERPPPGVRDLPLTEIEAEQPGRFMAVIYSGDGGWRDLDKEIGEHLSQRGVPVVGVDSLRYFWTEKKPDEIAKDLAEIIESYGDRFGTKQVLLVGYSFGAAVLPFAVSRLPAEVRSRILLVSFLGLGPRVDFQFHAEDWLGGEPDETAPLVLPELRKLDMARVQCFYGEDEDDSLCRDPGLAGADVIETKGGHHFDGGYGAIAQRIYDAAVKHLPPSP